MISYLGVSLHMKKLGTLFWLLIIIMTFHVFSSYCEFPNADDWVSIDCGNDNVLLDNQLVLWDTDDQYTDAGINKRVQVHQPLEIMDTLRSFPSSTKQNCYRLPIFKQKLRYLVKSGFLYGDYDGRGRPPTFDLHIDAKKLSTIKIASATEMIIDEVVYTSEESGVMNLCLVERKDGGVPFVSSIQAVPAGDGLYSKMQKSDTFRLVARINFGRDEKGYRDKTSESLLDDAYERLWTSGKTPPNCNNVSTHIDFNSPENDPPRFVTADAIESDNASSPIILTVDFPETSPLHQSAYVVLYFTENLSFFGHQNRTMNILINGQKMSTVTTDAAKCTVITLYPVAVRESTVNVTLVAANSTGLPPLINALEVFGKISTTAGGGGNPSVHLTCMSFILMLSAFVLATLL